MRLAGQAFCGKLLQIVYLRRGLQSQANGPEADRDFHVVNNNRQHVKDQENNNG